MKLKETEERDEEILLEEELPKPTKPTQVNEEELMREIEKNYLESHKNPGDPIISFEIINEGVTPTENCSA